MGDITDNTALVFDNQAAETYSGAISGSGAVDVEGPGALTFSGANTYSGGTTISGGTLQLGNGTTDGSLVGDITDNSALVFDDESALTYTGLIPGSGSVAQTGGGTLTLSGSNTYSGGTDIEGGTLQLGDGVANAGSVAGDILDNSALAFANPGAQTYSGVISGSGRCMWMARRADAQRQQRIQRRDGHRRRDAAIGRRRGQRRLGRRRHSRQLRVGLRQSRRTDLQRRHQRQRRGVCGRPGALTLSGSNTYSGGTDIEGGTLQLGDGVANAGSVAGDILDNSALAFANPGAQTYSGVISGSGAVYVDGPAR